MDKTITKVVRFDDETLEALAPLVQMAKDLRRMASQIELFLGGLESTMRLEMQSLDVSDDEGVSSNAEPILSFADFATANERDP